MSPISIGVLAVSMSLDAFIASVGKGASGPRPSLGNTLRTGMIFGVIEAITPLIGWAAGVAAAQYVSAVDHWIAFALLAGVGLHMALHSAPGEDEAPAASIWATIATAVGTSIDAMAVGVSLAFLQVNILLIALSVGVTTMLMSSTGLLVGRFIGRRVGRIAEVAGGTALIGLGSMILWEHLSAA